MSKLIKIVAGLVAIAALAYAGLMIYAPSTIGETLKEAEVSEGSLAGFNIGTTKDSLLAGTRASFNANSGQNGCNTGWAEPPAISPEQRACFFLKSDWGATSPQLYEFCPKRSDSHAELFFVQDRLAKVRAWCTRPL